MGSPKPEFSLSACEAEFAGYTHASLLVKRFYSFEEECGNNEVSVLPPLPKHTRMHMHEHLEISLNISRMQLTVQWGAMAFGGCRVWAKCYTGFKENQDDVMERVTLVGSVPSLHQATSLFTHGALWVALLL